MFVTSDDIMLNKLSISIKIHVVKPLVCLVSFQIVDRIRRHTAVVVSYIVANSVDTADATQLDISVASASAVCIGHPVIAVFGPMHHCNIADA